MFGEIKHDDEGENLNHNRLITTITVLFIVIFSSVIQASAFDLPSEISIMREIDFNKQVSKYPSIDNQTLAKYNFMQEAVKEADERYGEYQNICSNIPCRALSMSPPIELTYVFQVQGTLVNGIINDHNFNFHKEFSKSYITDVKIGNGIYFIRIIS